MTGRTADPAALVRHFYDVVWNQADADAARAILHPDLRFRASLGPERRGCERFIDYMLQVHAALGEYRCIIEDMITAGHRAVTRMTFTGIHRAEFFGVAATGRRITWSGAAFFTTRGGHIVDIWVLGDVDSVRRQLGAGDAARFE